MQMASNIKYLYTAVALIASLVRLSCAISCYTCHSSLDERCGDRFNYTERFLYDCTEETPLRDQPDAVKGLAATGCIKKVWKKDGGGVQVIKRACLWGDISKTENNCEWNRQTSSCVEMVLVCDSDACNSSSLAVPIAALISLCFALARYFTQ